MTSFIDSTNTIAPSSPNASDYVGYPHYWNIQPFERNHDFKIFRSWLEQNTVVSFYISAVYLVMILSLQRYMKNRQPVNVKNLFLLWNIVLSMFSIAGMCRGFPEILHVIGNFGFQYSVCENKFNSVTGFWITAFSISKAVELLETVFVLLRKKLTWIHLAHHVITLIATWHFVVEEPSLGRWMATMNFTVHAFMYAYFALKAAEVYLPEYVSFLITTLQIAQFVIGFVTALYATYVLSIGQKCNISFHIVAGLTFVNGYFFYIFGKYYLRRYFTVSPKSKIN